MRSINDNSPGRPGRGRREEGGFAMIAALLVTVLVTGLASAALLLSQMDVIVAGNYKAQRTGEVAADGGLELVKAMIYSRELTLPLSIPTANWADWSLAVPDTTIPAAVAAFNDFGISITLKYKLEDTINYNTNATLAEAVRYGKDYKYQQATRSTGRQPVYAAIVTDTKSGTKIQADLVSGIGFRTPAALFAVGVVHAQNYQYATEETIEMTSGTGTPAIATAEIDPDDGFTIEQVKETTVNPSAGDTTATVKLCDSSAASTTYKLSPAYVVEPNPPTPTTDTNYLHKRVYKHSEVVAQRNNGNYNVAREMTHLLFGVGSRYADLDTAYDNAGGGAAGRTAADNLFRFWVHCEDGCTNAPCATEYPASGNGYDNPTAFNNTTNPPTCDGIVCYNYSMPAGATAQARFEALLGTTFADLAGLADRTIPDTTSTPASLQIPCTTTQASFTDPPFNFSNGCNLSDKVLGTADDPAVVYFNHSSGTNTLVTNAGTQFSGYGVLVINGDADIIGSINWTGLMLIRGKMTFRPWQGGTATTRSGPELATRWNGYIMIGGKLDLWTYFGGSIILGYDSEEIATINDIIARAVPHKTLTWRRVYD